MMAQRRFPIPTNHLEGRRLLVIAVQRTSPDRAYLFSGVAESAGDTLRLADRDQGTVREFDLEGVPVRGFDPANALKCMAAGRDRMLTLLEGVDACVAFFTDTIPPGGTCIADAFYGVGQAANGELLLVQGEDENVDSEEESDV